MKCGQSSLDTLLNTSKDLVFYDTETCGFHSMGVLLQFAVANRDIVLWEIWHEPVEKTLEIIEAMMGHVTIGFNLAFDHFHLQKLHAIWSLLPGNWIPVDHINDIAAIENSAIDCKCIRPYSALDLLLYSRRGPYQSLMARSDIRIKRVPLTPVAWNGDVIPMAYAVASHLEKTIELNGIYFAKRADPEAPRWNVIDRAKDGKVDREFADVVLKFNADGGLKSLAEHALGKKPKQYSEIRIDKKYLPVELGYAPYASVISNVESNWEYYEDGNLTGFAWPGVVEHHINHWHESQNAREYAYDDIVYTRELYYHFESPDHGDTDSILSCMVASVRWRGFDIDLPGMEELREGALDIVKKSPINTNKPSEVRSYINEVCDDTEQLHLEETTGRAKLQEQTQWTIEKDEDCLKCMCGIEPNCLRCGGTGVLSAGIHPAADRAKQIMGIKIAKKQIELYDKFIIAGRFHASFKVGGTLSNRMSGGTLADDAQGRTGGKDSINPMGINKDPEVRNKFPLKSGKYKLCGGDFDSFEVTIADSVYLDPDFRKFIVLDKKIHAWFGTFLFPEYSYEQILDSEKNPGNYPFGDMYTKSKSCVFARLYFGDATTFNKNFGIAVEYGEKAVAEWDKLFPNMNKVYEQTIKDHQPLIQAGGIGTAIIWNEPKEYVESFLGYRRYFTLEYKIVKSLFELARNQPKGWSECKVPVLRSEYRGIQTTSGAVASALYGSAFSIAEACVRAAGNHCIQSVGADCTKIVQVEVWKRLQPVGVNEFIVAPMQIHDELEIVTHPSYVEELADIIEEVVEDFREKIPLIGMKWSLDMDNWAQKSGSGEVRHITYDKQKVIEELELIKS